VKEAAPAKVPTDVTLYILPDPNADTVDNSVITGQASKALLAVNTLLAHKYGNATVKNSAAIAEVEVKFAKDPVSVTKDPVFSQNISTHRLEITGSTDKPGYVYCWVDKAGEERVKNETTGNATNQTV